MNALTQPVTSLARGFDMVGSLPIQFFIEVLYPVGNGTTP
jgi:hypothetical protein